MFRKVLSKFNRHVFGWCSISEFACMCVAIELYMTIYMNAEGKTKTMRLRMISFSEQFCVKWYDLHVIVVK